MGCGASVSKPVTNSLSKKGIVSAKKSDLMKVAPLPESKVPAITVQAASSMNINQENEVKKVVEKRKSPLDGSAGKSTGKVAPENENGEKVADVVKVVVVKVVVAEAVVADVQEKIEGPPMLPAIASPENTETVTEVLSVDLDAESILPPANLSVSSENTETLPVDLAAEPISPPVNLPVSSENTETITEALPVDLAAEPISAPANFPEGSASASPEFVQVVEDFSIPPPPLSDPPQTNGDSMEILNWGNTDAGKKETEGSQDPLDAPALKSLDSVEIRDWAKSSEIQEYENSIAPDSLGWRAANIGQEASIIGLKSQTFSSEHQSSLHESLATSGIGKSIPELPPLSRTAEENEAELPFNPDGLRSSEEQSDEKILTDLTTIPKSDPILDTESTQHALLENGPSLHEIEDGAESSLGIYNTLESMPPLKDTETYKVLKNASQSSLVNENPELAKNLNKSSSKASIRNEMVKARSIQSINDKPHQSLVKSPSKSSGKNFEAIQEDAMRRVYSNHYLAKSASKASINQDMSKSKSNQSLANKSGSKASLSLNLATSGSKASIREQIFPNNKLSPREDQNLSK